MRCLRGCNFPLGGELFAILARHLKDKIPAHYATSIDPNLHGAGPLQMMTDAMFSTPRYAVWDVELHSGVSDHCAVT
jgi:hypothetical protein